MKLASHMEQNDSVSVKKKRKKKKTTTEGTSHHAKWSFINLLMFQDSFKYSYPPLVDDDFQTPLCENGPITSEDEHESKEEIDADAKETGDVNEEQNLNQKKVSD